MSWRGHGNRHKYPVRPACVACLHHQPLACAKDRLQWPTAGRRCKWFEAVPAVRPELEGD